MGSPSAHGARAHLAAAVSDLVQTYRDALTTAHHDQTPFTPQALTAYWPDIDADRIAAAILGRAKPAPHLVGPFRATAAPQLAGQVRRANAWFGEELWIRPDRPPMSVEYVAGGLVADLVQTCTVRWRRLHQAVSKSYWAGRAAADGKAVYGRTPSGRARRARITDLIDVDDMHAGQQQQTVNFTDVRVLTSGGVERRLARSARLQRGWTQRDVQACAGGPGWLLTYYPQWENPNTPVGPDGFPQVPSGFRGTWAMIADALGLPDNVDNGPLIPQVISPPGHRWHLKG